MTYFGQRFIPPVNERPESASVLIIVLWIAFGLVSVALMFAHSMMLEYRAADNSLANCEADQAIESARRYTSFILANLEEPGQLPELDTYEWEFVTVGDSVFWLLGRSDEEMRGSTPVFGLTDEASKLNLNTATLEMLEALPGMTTALAAAIVDWRDTDAELTQEGAESEYYLLLEPSYNCKDSRFETIEELRLVAGADWEILTGEDTNRNGILDPNENDGEISLPYDNRNGILEPGILEYVTVYSREPNTDSEGEDRINIKEDLEDQLAQLLQETFGEDRAEEIVEAAGFNVLSVESVLEYFISSQMTLDEFSQIADKLTVSGGSLSEGAVNVNTASAAVLACIPGIGDEYASQLTAYRQGKTDELDTIAWVAEILDDESASQAGPYLTVKSYQFTADVVAVGHEGRGFSRSVFVFDTSEEDPAVVYRRDLRHLGWPMGAEIRNQLAVLSEEKNR